MSVNPSVKSERIDLLATAHADDGRNDDDDERVG